MAPRCANVAPQINPEAPPSQVGASFRLTLWSEPLPSSLAHLWKPSGALLELLGLPLTPLGTSWSALLEICGPLSEKRQIVKSESNFTIYFLMFCVGILNKNTKIVKLAIQKKDSDLVLLCDCPTLRFSCFC